MINICISILILNSIFKIFQVQLNGKPSEYPAFSGELSAWRRYHTVNMRSNAGVMAVCSLNLDACAFHISGYYFDKVRGLLGTLNNEDYDDFTLPNNKVNFYFHLKFFSYTKKASRPNQAEINHLAELANLKNLPYVGKAS